MRWKRLIGKPLRAYTRHSPIQKGKNVLQRILSPRMENMNEMEAVSIFNTRFHLTFPEDGGWECIDALGTYESGTSTLCKKILRAGDIVFDVGANIGWYTYLFEHLVGPKGAVHAFEPVPWIYEKLVFNGVLNGCGDNLKLNRLALGGCEGTIDLYTFKERPHGETSARLRKGFTVSSSSKADMGTLDQYVQQIGNPAIALIKVDVEGLELEVLNGALRLLQLNPPMWLFEINHETSTAFGWAPSDLFHRLRKNHGYRFLRMKRGWGKPKAVKSVEEFTDGDNVFCFLPERHHGRISKEA